MYHFMFGFLGASAVAAAPSAPARAARLRRLVLLRFFLRPAYGCFFLASRFFCDSFRLRISSSVSNRNFASANRESVRLEIIEQRGHAVLNDVVDHGEIQRENEYRDHDHGGRGLHFLPRRRRHLAHFGAHVVVEGPDPFRPGLDLVAEAATRSPLNSPFSSSRLPFRYSLNLPLPSKTLAGAEGFEPPSSVLETDSLTVELTPL